MALQIDRFEFDLLAFLKVRNECVLTFFLNFNLVTLLHMPNDMYIYIYIIILHHFRVVTLNLRYKIACPRVESF